jgi:hypothetical protein
MTRTERGAMTRRSPAMSECRLREAPIPTGRDYKLTRPLYSELTNQTSFYGRAADKIALRTYDVLEVRKEIR